MNKNCIDSNRMNFNLNIRMKDISTINKNDTIKLWVSHQNLAGEQSSAVILTEGFSEKELLSREMNLEYIHDIEDYKEDFPSWKYNNLEIIPQKYYGIYSNFKIIKYSIIRNNIVIEEFELG